jgi:hypothetical protein
MRLGHPDTDPLDLRRLPERLDFTVEWLDHDGVVFAENVVRKHDLTGACRWAAAQMSRGTGNAAGAHGLFVRRSSDE